MKSISLYVDNGTYLTKIHPFTKLFYIVTAVLSAVISGNLWVYVIFVGISSLALISAGLFKKAIPLVVFSFTVLIVIFLIQGLFYYKNVMPLLALGPLTFYREGVLHATRIGFNILNMLFSFAIFVLSTKPQDLVEELEKKGFSPRFGYIITSVFQIIPQMMGTMNTITDAQRSRGMETEGSLFVRAKAFIPLISPVVMNSLTNTRERAIALEVRGFDSKEKKTYLSEWKKRKSDTVLNILFAVIIAGVIVWRIGIF
ncbi:MAG: energy-coupling factor transporter transmembrane protein EcfT [Roseburia sp.]|nr:energy-coupling factor transporter transmembrane protein EcfT [Roseburia sp.]